MKKIQSYQAIIQFWAIIGTPAKRHFPPPPLPPPKKKKKKKKTNLSVGPPLTKLSGSAHAPLRPTHL